MRQMPDDGRERICGRDGAGPDSGRAWRELLMPVLAELGHACFNPCEEELRVATARSVRDSGRGRRPGPAVRANHAAYLDHDLAALEDVGLRICYWDRTPSGRPARPRKVTLARWWGSGVSRSGDGRVEALVGPGVWSGSSTR